MNDMGVVSKDRFVGSWTRHRRECDLTILWKLLPGRESANRPFTRLPSAAARAAGTHTCETVSMGFNPES